MAISLVDTFFSNPGASVDLSTGATIAENDVVLCFTGSDGSNLDDVPSGDNSGTMSTIDIDWDGFVDCSAFYSIQGATVDTSITGLDSSTVNVNLVTVWRGVDVSTGPFDTTPIFQTGEASGDGQVDPAAITTNTDGAVIICLYVEDDGQYAVSSGPSGYTLITFGGNNEVQVGSGTAGCTGMAAYKVKATAGSDDPGTFSTDGDDRWIGKTVALKPAAGGGAANPHNPFGHPLKGPFGGPIGATPLVVPKKRIWVPGRNPKLLRAA